MNNNNVIKGNSEEEIWQQIGQQFAEDPDFLEYEAMIQQSEYHLVLNIDIDLGGGFESGYETTSMIAPLPAATDFRFAIHREYFTDEIGKFFGMQDVVIGYPEFDKQLIIKTNNEDRVKAIFADKSVRETFQTLDDFTFGISSHNITESQGPSLELMIESGITDVDTLRKLYSSFVAVLRQFGSAN